MNFGLNQNYVEIKLKKKTRSLPPSGKQMKDKW